MYIVGRRIGVPRRAFGPLDRPARQPCRSGDRPRFRRPGCARLRASVPPDGALWSGRPARRGGASPEHWQGIRPVELREAAGDRPVGPGAPRLPGWTAALPAAAPTPGSAGEERCAKGVPWACSEHRGAFSGARVGIHARGRCRIPLIQRGGLIAEHVPDRDSACPARIDRAQDLSARLPRHAGALPAPALQTPLPPPRLRTTGLRRRKCGSAAAKTAPCRKTQPSVRTSRSNPRCFPRSCASARASR